MSEKRIRTALLSNAVFSACSGLALILGGRFVANIMGLGAPLLYQIIGGGLVVFAAYVTWVATRTPIDTFEALQICSGDIAWVVGTLAIIAIAFGGFTSEGIAALLIVAVIVGTFAVLQLDGINRSFAVPQKNNTFRICLAIDTSEPAGRMWPIVADLTGIKRYSPKLSHVHLRDGAQPGEGAVRQCTDTKGKTWAERCTRYDPDARTLDVEFLAGEPDFPFPFRSMTGGWEIVPKASGSTVNIWFEVTPKHAFATPMILPLMAKGLRAEFGDVVARMTAESRGESINAEQATPATLKRRVRSQLVPCN